MRAIELFGTGWRRGCATRSRAGTPPRPEPVRTQTIALGPRPQPVSLGPSWAPGDRASLPAMSHRQLVLIAALALTAVAPATAAAAPTVTVTGDTGQPVPLNTASHARHPQHGRHRRRRPSRRPTRPPTGPRSSTRPAPPASDAQPVPRRREFGPTWNNYADYRGNGTYTRGRALLRRTTTAPAPPRAQSVFQLRHQRRRRRSRRRPTKLLTRAPNSFVTNTHEIGVDAQPGRDLVRGALRARRRRPAPTARSRGPSAETFVEHAPPASPTFRFDKPGRYVIVARAQRGQLLHPVERAPSIVTAIAPFDLERVTFPDSRGPSYKLRGQVRERVARGRVTIYDRQGAGRRASSAASARAKINSKGRFTKRFRVRGYGKYRLRYTYKGNEPRGRRPRDRADHDHAALLLR